MEGGGGVFWCVAAPGQCQSPRLLPARCTAQMQCFHPTWGLGAGCALLAEIFLHPGLCCSHTAPGFIPVLRSLRISFAECPVHQHLIPASAAGTSPPGQWGEAGHERKGDGKTGEILFAIPSCAVFPVPGGVGAPLTSRCADFAHY